MKDASLSISYGKSRLQVLHACPVLMLTCMILIVCSVGIENVEDLIRDLTQALEKV